jgi:alpha-beta hydrolase superfamily lysophospholipase
MEYVRDLDTFFHHLQKAHGLTPERTVVVAHSVGGVVAAAWVHDFAPRIAGLVLATPALEVNLIVPGALTSIRVMQKLKPDATIKSYVRGSWLTRDLNAAAVYDADKLISKDISAKILVDLFDTAQRVISDAEVMDRPLLLFPQEPTSGETRGHRRALHQLRLRAKNTSHAQRRAPCHLPRSLPR